MALLGSLSWKSAWAGAVHRVSLAIDFALEVYEVDVVAATGNDGSKV